MPKDTVPKQRSTRPATAAARSATDAPGEQLLVANYTKMDDGAREMISRLAAKYADDLPRDWVTLPADIQDAQREAGISSVESPLPGTSDEALSGAADPSKLDAALDSIADDSDDIDCALADLGDLLRVALNECGRVGEAASYVETVIRAARRYAEDISVSNMHLQRFIGVLAGKAA